MISEEALISGIRELFQSHADEEAAVQMSWYMKYRFQFYGIKTPVRRQLTKDYLSGQPQPSTDELEKIVKLAYKEDQREMHHFAIELVRQMVCGLPEESINLVKYLIINNSWWDTVDFIATKIVGEMAVVHPGIIGVMDQWIHDPDMWLQRTAILYQLKYKKETDTDRLFSYCLICAKSKEFFIRKAIGWALREYSKTDADAVIRFIEGEPLSSLSKREGLKWLRHKGLYE